MKIFTSGTNELYFFYIKVPIYFIFFFKTVRDPMTTYSLACIIRECVSMKAGKLKCRCKMKNFKRRLAGKNRNPAINQLIQLNASQSLIKIVHGIHSRDGISANESLIQQFLWILSHLAQKGEYCLLYSSFMFFYFRTYVKAIFSMIYRLHVFKINH